MGARRTVLLAAWSLAALAGCADDGDDSGTALPSSAGTAAASTTATSAATNGPTTSAAPSGGAGSSATPTTAGSTSTSPDLTAAGGRPSATATPLAELSSPVDLAWRPGEDTLFVAQQDGTIAALVDGESAAVLDMSDLTEASGERGLLGLAFHPTEPLAYVNYTDLAGDTVIDEYAVSRDGTFDPATRRQVLTIDQPFPNHNGGEVLFGPDGYLYIGTGDGGSGGDPERRAADLSTLLGKVLRIDPAGGDPYAVPEDNPFAGDPAARPEIWSYGLRNPWRMSFDRLTGDLWIGDVGQGDWEEIDLAPAADGAGRGANFGWSALEGSHPYNSDVPAAGAIPPVHEYDHSHGACSVSGGVLYRGAAIPGLFGWFVFADLCTGEVQAFSPATGEVVVLDTLTRVSAVTEGPDGELYVLALDAGVYVLG